MSTGKRPPAAYGDTKVVEPAAGGRTRPHGVVALISSGDRHLLIRRARFVSAPGWWCLPGGEIEPDETEAAALVRELHEELGIQVQPIRSLWRAVTAWGVDLVWWLAEWEQTPGNDVLRPDPGEVDQVSWFTAEEALRLDRLLGSNVAFFNALPGLHPGEPAGNRASLTLPGTQLS